MQLPRKLSDWMGKRCSGGLLVLGLLLFASSPVAAQGRHAEGEGCCGITSCQQRSTMSCYKLTALQARSCGT